ncbi:hypothetical protein GQ53DRAFT_89266 [Thozetella sp. PMI_491]|nr:hypothetical protein GQ53DRAFT_89266 [Thozetella sp. PMI_491]
MGRGRRDVGPDGSLMHEREDIPKKHTQDGGRLRDTLPKRPAPGTGQCCSLCRPICRPARPRLHRAPTSNRSSNSRENPIRPILGGTRARAAATGPEPTPHSLSRIPRWHSTQVRRVSSSWIQRRAVRLRVLPSRVRPVFFGASPEASLRCGWQPGRR